MATKRTSQSQDPKDNSTIPDIEQTLSKDLLKDLLSEQYEVKEPEAKTVTPQQFENLIESIRTNYNCDNKLALAGLFCTLQAGGTNKSKRSNVKITLNGTSFESKKINEIISKHVEVTPRQLARIYANDIFLTARKFNITGNAFVTLNRYYSHMLTQQTDNEKYWAADFQLDNPSCPQYIRDALQKRYTDKFSAKAKK
jgi:hypothetical protein